MKQKAKEKAAQKALTELGLDTIESTRPSAPVSGAHAVNQLQQIFQQLKKPLPDYEFLTASEGGFLCVVTVEGKKFEVRE